MRKTWVRSLKGIQDFHSRYIIRLFTVLVNRGCTTRNSLLATPTCRSTLRHCREFLPAQVQGQATEKLFCDEPTGGLLGSNSFVAAVERSLGRIPRPQKPRPQAST